MSAMETYDEAALLPTSSLLRCRRSFMEKLRVQPRGGDTACDSAAVLY